MTDNKVARYVLPQLRVKATPFAPKVRKELAYTPELIKAIWARNVYRRMTNNAIAAELGLNAWQIAKAIGLGRKLLVKEAWAVVIPQLVYNDVLDTPEPAKVVTNVKVKVKQTRTLKTEPKLKWPSALIKWAMAQADFNGHGSTSIARAIAESGKFITSPSATTVNFWISRTLKHTSQLVVVKEDCDLYDFPVRKVAPGRKPKNMGPQPQCERPKKISIKAKRWAVEKADKLIADFDLTAEDLA